MACFVAAVLADWVVTWGYTLVTGRTAERMLFGLRIKIFAHLQRLSLDYYDRELGGRIMTRMTTDVEALSQLIQTGLINAVVGLLHLRRRVRVPRSSCRRRWRWPPRSSCRRCSLRHLVVPPALVGRLRPGPRLDRRRQRQPPGEPVGRAGDAGLRARGPQRRRASARSTSSTSATGSAPSG